MIEYKDLDAKKNSDGLVPAIIQDCNTLKVLMLGYMNQEAFEKTQKEGVVTFFSRTKNRLWTKGETSGNFLNVKEIYKDCDDDTLLIKVEPVGNVCHRGTVSCFDTPDNEGFIRKLEAVIVGRHKDMPAGSYTTHLFNKGVNKMAQKVGEEAVETVIEAIAGNDERLIYEASDLMYHSLVLLISKGFTIKDIEEELAKRHK
ncbi:MAG: bifunctional phosphoribosyl-AMP cyclohydrolase/phosphoribosyl-ATP diphosphatase HisIE [Bacteroidetes bacterium]|nr:bifunctional phosphoribosyl-AMP cyclohydrolase/phosphoribosyl-ATP diphosphatase HisIE [Bacteroidota bacterium]